MKRNDYLMLAGTLAYSFLFYHQWPGINFPVFTAIYTGLLLLANPSLAGNKKWWALAVLCLFSSLTVCLHRQSVSVIASLVSWLLLSGASFSTSSSFILSVLYSAFTFILMPVDMINRVTQRLENREIRQKSTRLYTLLSVLFVLVFSVIFFMLYRDANPLFAENTKWVNLDFISFEWLLFTAGGFFVIYGLMRHRRQEQIQELIDDATGRPAPARELSEARLQAEANTGIILFLMLNAMLLLLNVGDAYTIFFNGNLPAGITHSDFVHRGVGNVIISIILATLFIMIIYRYRLLSAQKRKWLTPLVYLWLSQNVLMLLSTSWRNWVYISEYNLTYKRIGVYVWLFLALVGLCLLGVKIWKNQTNWHLIRKNFAAWMLVLCASSAVNWDVMITRFNLANQPPEKVDFFYLLSLSEKNIPELLSITNDQGFEKISGNRAKEYERYYGKSYALDFKKELGEKIRRFNRDYVDSWPSWCMSDARIIQSLNENNIDFKN